MPSFCRAHGAAQCLMCKPPEKSERKSTEAPKPIGRQMNKTEARYATLLEGLRLAGEIMMYQYEAVTLKLGPDLRYTPDFLVLTMEGGGGIGVEFHEVKGGYAREDSLVKIKAASHQFPFFHFNLCRYQKGNWDIRTIA